MHFLVPDHYELVGRRLGQPLLAAPAKNLPDIARVTGQIKHFKPFTLRVEPNDQVTAKGGANFRWGIGILSVTVPCPAGISCSEVHSTAILLGP